MSELIEARYHARELQVNEILRNFTDSASSGIDKHKDDIERLEVLLNTMPMLLGGMIERAHQDNETFYLQALAALKFVASRDKVVSLLSDLSKISGDQHAGLSEVPIDKSGLFLPYPLTPRALNIAFKERLAQLEQTIAEADGQAAIDLLEMTQGETPLMRYRKDIAKLKFQLIPTLSGGQIGYVPTKIPNINLKFCYDAGDQLPRLSFQVNPFI